ncbi:MAG: HAD-IIIA family hydrolase [Candidatus Eremiobacteraeota bacterium]|nr:HAD-IIIA family hydrolase [Candidatus Eremiobacteraeota bacterium]MBC5801970.1 HAD-IIIA family hydrolase [Candidatus Eremiobacteraeota bacterium]MBC5820713.1 HAD-IIIA family hydrolase [Candidatus Eremiobacteraeota bacterium]
MNYDVVIPTIGRPSLGQLLTSLARADGPLPGRVFVVDDRRERSSDLRLGELGELGERIRIVAAAGAGPAGARNRGWRRSQAPWIAFLDDDVVVEAAWRRKLAADLQACDEATAGTQGRVRVPLPTDRRPTDWERNVGALERSRWITADCAYRRADLRAVDGFDERFPRAYREDAELALRLFARGRMIAVGTRCSEHPVRGAGPWISVRLQAGNADDALMEALHGRAWRQCAGIPRGRFRHHVTTVAFGCAALGCATAWLLATLRFAWERIAPGPRDAREIATMLATSAAIPFAAVYHRARGRARLWRTLRRTHRLPCAVLFDRDGTLVVDEPDLREPAHVRLMPGARAALDRLRDAGIAVGIVTNQPAVGEGRLTPHELSALHGRLTELGGPFATIQSCTHPAAAGCGCRKPQPGLILAAASTVGCDPRDCIVVGDIGSDVAAAAAAGARAILVPTPLTLPAELAQAPLVARDVGQAVTCILDGRA